MEYQNVNNMDTDYLREVVEAAAMKQAHKAGLSPYDPAVAKLKKRAIKSIETLEYYRDSFADSVCYEDFTLEAKYLKEFNEVVFQITHISGISSGWMSGKDLEKAAYALWIEDYDYDTTMAWLDNVTKYYKCQIQSRVDLLSKRYTCKTLRDAGGSYRFEVNVIDTNTGLVLNVDCDATGFYAKFLPWFYKQIQAQNS